MEKPARASEMPQRALLQLALMLPPRALEDGKPHPLPVDVRQVRDGMLWSTRVATSAARLRLASRSTEPLELLARVRLDGLEAVLRELSLDAVKPPAPGHCHRSATVHQDKTAKLRILQLRAEHERKLDPVVVR